MKYRVAALFSLMYLTSVLLGYAASPSRPPLSSLQMTPITDFKSVAGEWEGLLKGLSHRDDFVQVTIDEDGSYEFASYRTTGVFSGSGKLTLSDGRLAAIGKRGTTTWTLYTGGDERRLKVNAVDENRDVSADLSPAKKKAK